MIFVILSLLLYQVATGMVEGIKNIQLSTPRTRWNDENSYHWYRMGQGAAVILFGAACALTGCSGRLAAVVACSWIAGNGLYSRILIKFAWGKWNYNWNNILIGSHPWWTLFDLSPAIDWIIFLVFTVIAILI